MAIGREAGVDHELAADRAEVFLGRRCPNGGADRRRGARRQAQAHHRLDRHVLERLRALARLREEPQSVALRET